MRHAHVASGGRYPVLRTLAILYLIGAAVTFISGLLVSGWELLFAPDALGYRVRLATLGVGATILTTLAVVAVAELIKLLIDIEHNTRVAAMLGAASAAGATMSTPGEPDGKGRLTWLEGEETAEGALIRGH